ncbi:M50 family metallopeptidase [Ureibacillus terrenus]|uniref:M50 family metallopeptidase n=1 Tax=Ureibacillus terrenus TaxID=118246 RepID=UPI002E1C69D2|nr:M50 family metallopeptidase [Ureibacillus terrenus]
MDERAYAAMKRMTIHPLFLPLLFGLILYGNVSYYALILSSLLIHEFGHILVAWLLGVKVQRCVIMPYGGEIELEGGYALSPQKQLLISLGGPIATVCCMLVAPFLDPLLAKPLIKIQMILLLINLIPVWPLDGGRIVFSLILIFSKKAKVYEMFISISFILITSTVIITFILLPKTLFLFLLSLFLWINIIQEWRYRKYRVAFEKYVMNRLT